MEIIFYASNDTLGDTSTIDCGRFRKWAKKELELEYPDYDIIVSEENSLMTAFTDDFDNEYDIIDFCSRLWENFPW